jgi:hypothetical protein
MSTSEPNLSQDEQTLHHLAAKLKNKLEGYHAHASRDDSDERTCRNELRAILVYFFFLKSTLIS